MYSKIGFDKPGYCQNDWFRDNPGRYIFRFTNDPGQSLHSAYHSPSVKDGYYGIVNGNGNMESAAMIAYRQRKDLTNATRKKNLSYAISIPIPANAQENTSDIGQQATSIDRERGVPISNFNERIEEFTTFDGNGTRFVYSLPVYSRNEYDLQFFNLSINNNKSNRIVYSNQGNIKNLANNVFVTGQQVSSLYAHAYMPTQILSSDYYDIDNNGPDAKDQGTYVLLHYRNNGFVKWRSPYQGFLNSQASKKDGLYDGASVSYGEKEQVYLSSIRTKTHIAYFITNKTNTSVSKNGGTILLQGSLQERQDAYPPHQDESIAGNSIIPPRTSNRKEVLERVEIYTLDESSKPVEKIKTVHFSYSYDLMKNTPDAAPNTGKLTLKNVWEENFNIKEAYISKYSFEYTYPIAAPVNTPVSYTSLFSPPSAPQNPDFNPETIDAWGYRQTSNRYSQLKYWNNQNEGTNFDPAVWNLKTITTPTGSIIYVQYEQNDYSYIQDKYAMTMQKVVEVISNGNVHECTVEVDASNRQNIIKYINQKNVRQQEFMYCRFQYDVTANQTFGTRVLDGYFRCSDVRSHSNSDKIIIRMIGDPIDIANDFSKKHDRTTGIPGGDPSISFILAFITASVSALTTAFSPNPVINTENSYIKIPLLSSKKGGGIRTKRILTESPSHSLEAGGQMVLYGEEYIYKTFDTELGRYISSGVATNEPSLISFENPLTGILPTASQYYKNESKYIYGDDKSASEGPIHQGFLPSPSIGYSSIFTKSINTGPSSGGYIQREFFTVKDYPTIKFQQEEPEINSDMPSVFNLTIPFLYEANRVTKNWSNVKYTLSISQRHGLQKAVTHFAGTLDIDIFQNSIPTLGEVVSRSEYNYYDDQEAKPVLYSKNKPLRFEHLGQVREYWGEDKMLFQQNHFHALEASVAANTTLFPPAWFGLNRRYNFSQDILTTRCAVVCETNVPFLKEIVTKSDNMESSMSYLAFDPHTGAPVLTKSKGIYTTTQSGNSLKDTYVYTYALPAYTENDSKQFSSKTMNEGVIIIADNPGTDTYHESDSRIGKVSSIKIQSSNINFTVVGQSPDAGEVLSDLLTIGDIIEIQSFSSPMTQLYSIGSTISTSSQGNYSFSLNSLNSSPILNQDTIIRVTIKKSGYENKMSYPSETIVLADTDNNLNTIMEDITSYAKKLYERSKGAEVLNTVLFRAREVSPTEIYGEYRNSLTGEQNFTSMYEITPTVFTVNDYILNEELVYNDFSIPHNFFFRAFLNRSNQNLSIRYGFYNKIDIPPPSDPWVEAGAFSWVSVNHVQSSQFSINDDGNFTCVRKKYSDDLPILRIYPRCGKRYSSTNDCMTSNSSSVLIGSQRKNAFPSEVYPYTISANHIVYSTEYDLIPERLATSITHPIGLVQKKLKPYKTFILRNSALSGGTANYNYGTQPFTPFIPNDPRWKLLSIMASYNELGIPVSIGDDFGMYSTNRFGNNGILPLCTGSQSRAFRNPGEYYHDIYFQSFEDYSPLIRTGGSVINTVSHTGRKCLRISQNGTSTIQHNITPSDYNPGNRAYEISFWASSDNIAYSTNLNFSIGGINCYVIAPVAKTVTIDNNGILWFLYRLQGTNVNNLFTSALTLQIQNSESNSDLYIDDLKIRPIESSTVCYVYNPRTYQVDAILDDEHFASVTQYDMRGIPVRSLRETVGGWKTVAEQTMNIVRTNRPYLYPSASNPIIPQMRDNGSAIKNTQYSLPDNSQMNAKQFNSGQVDLFQLQLSPDSKHMRVLGVDADSSQSTKKKQQSRSEPK